MSLLILIVIEVLIPLMTTFKMYTNVIKLFTILMIFKVIQSIIHFKNKWKQSQGYSKLFNYSLIILGVLLWTPEMEDAFIYILQIIIPMKLPLTGIVPFSRYIVGYFVCKNIFS